MRNLSELTPNEGAGLWDAIMPQRYCCFKGQAIHFKANETAPERFCFMQGVERLGIHVDGYIWADSDLIKIEIDQDKINAYLLSIDIDRGYAQQPNTINQ